MKTGTLALAAAAALLTTAAAASAQRVHDVPARPALWAGADTNSATTYYLLGVQRLERDPGVAAAAFYWAERLNPGWPQALYARRVALLMTSERRLESYLAGQRSAVTDPQVLAIDSLLLRAVQREPFLNQQLDKQMLMMYLRGVYTEAVRQATGRPDGGLAEFELQTVLADAGPEFKAWMNAASGLIPAAIEGYEQTLRHARYPNSTRLILARLHYLSGDYAKSAQYLREALDDERGRDRRDVVRVYESKAVMEFSRAAALERGGDLAGAREGYGKALTEDLSFWPAHRRLADMALAAGDTTAAQAEMALAVEIAPDEADLRYAHGVLLLQARKVVEAAAELAKAAELDPYYAAPHFLLAYVHDQSSMHDEALEHYRAYLRLAAHDDANRGRAEERMAALASVASAPPQR